MNNLLQRYYNVHAVVQQFLYILAFAATVVKMYFNVTNAELSITMKKMPSFVIPVAFLNMVNSITLFVQNFLLHLIRYTMNKNECRQ